MRTKTLEDFVDKRVERLLDRNPTDQSLLWIISGSPCGCMGPRDGEPFCHCEMNSLAARSILESRGYKIP